MGHFKGRHSTVVQNEFLTMSLLSEDEVEQRLAVFRARKQRVKKMMNVDFTRLSEMLGMPKSSIMNWVKWYKIPIRKYLIQKYHLVDASEENIKALLLVKELMYIEGYTVEGTKRQIKLRGLLDDKHFSK